MARPRTGQADRRYPNVAIHRNSFELLQSLTEHFGTSYPWVISRILDTHDLDEWQQQIIQQLSKPKG